MAAPNPALIVSNPPPLQSADFPFAVLPFPAGDFVSIADLIQPNASPAATQNSPQTPVNPYRLEPTA